MPGAVKVNRAGYRMQVGYPLSVYPPHSLLGRRTNQDEPTDHHSHDYDDN
jgi:hypothetical protein